ncbi:OCIA domain-containing protein [Desmophyllum pertusum]|uniref:OCIA domain-containing protein n=1 Tax=Desmophyllum pertusum TaxID=174260 RepID=A0A9X0CRC8_9CNID|nr:OCIA domain-containing protein [Desmophyllum pertusum]
MADGAASAPQQMTELTDEEKAVLKKCSRNGIIRGISFSAAFGFLTHMGVKYGFAPLRGFPGIMYTLAIGTGFYTGISSYKGACRKMILQLENSQLKDYMLSVENKAKSAGQGIPHGGQSDQSEQQELDLQAENIRFGASQEKPSVDDHIPLPSNIATSTDEDVSRSEDARTPPSLYFDVDEAKENKYTSFEELRKKHRGRWTPPNVSSSGPNRLEQPKHRREGEQDSRPGSSDVSWFDQDNSSEDLNRQEPGQRSNNLRDRSSYRQGPPPRKNKYGDYVE